MEFPFSVARLFNLESEGVVALTARSYAAMGARERERVDNVINAMGRGSMLAQRIPQQITTPHHVSAVGHVLFLAVSGNRCLGILKGGEKHLFMLDSANQTQEMDALCCLDFYTHESMQRRGVGITLFRAMEQHYGIRAEGWAFDKPSPKLLGFLRKHYGISGMRPQTNNFLMHASAITAWGNVFRQCFRRSAVLGGHSQSALSSGPLGTSGLTCDMLERVPAQYRVEITPAGSLLRSKGVVEADLWKDNPFTGVPSPQGNLEVNLQDNTKESGPRPAAMANTPAERTAAARSSGKAQGTAPGSSEAHDKENPLATQSPLHARTTPRAHGTAGTADGIASQSVAPTSREIDRPAPSHIGVDELLSKRIVVSPTPDVHHTVSHQSYVRPGYNQAETIYTKKAESLADQQRSLNARTATIARFMGTHGGYGIGGMSQESYERYIKDMEEALH